MQYSKDNFGTKLLAFAGDKGFYIILILCAIAIGISGYVLFFTGNDSNPDASTLEPNLTAADESNGSSMVIPPVSVTIEGETPNETDTSVSGQVEGVETPSADAPKIPSKSSTSVNKPAQTASNPVNVSKAVYVLPVEGQVLRTFSGNDLVYDETMGDWRVHCGVDFSANEGTQVHAIANGTVKSVYTDELAGNCITITHANGLVSYYFGLLANTTMKPGMVLSAGDVIGGVGNTMKMESNMTSHVHVAVTKDGKYIDPMSLIK